ncbi:MAG: DUF4190 domain-containing protein [Armatimonadota bacterium]
MVDHNQDDESQVSGSIDPQGNHISDQRSRKASVPAIASLTLGILGFLTCGLTVLPGLLFGIIALYRIRSDKGAYTGRSLAIAGIATSAVALVFILPFFLAYAHKDAEIHHKSGCFYRVASIGLAMSMYKGDNDDHLPSSDRWISSISSYVNSFYHSESPFVCPSVAGKQPCYAMNRILDDIDANDVADASKTVMVFESIPGDNLSGGKELLPDPPRHGSSARNKTGGIYEFYVFRYIKDQYIIAFLDGHAKKPTVEMVDSYIWNPKGIKTANERK